MKPANNGKGRGKFRNFIAPVVDPIIAVVQPIVKPVVATVAAVVAAITISTTLTTTVQAADKYVDDTGCSNTPGGGSSGTPFCTVSYALDAASLVNPGDHIKVRNGTYTDLALINRLSGSAGNPTVIEADTGHTAVIFDGPGVSSDRIKFDGVSYMSIIGVEIRDYNQCLFVDSASHHIVIQNNEIHNCGQEALRVRGNSHDITIEGNEIYDTAMWGPAMYNGEGIYIGSGGESDETYNVTVSGNNIHDVQDECIELKGDTHGVTVDDNDLDQCMTPGSAYSSGGGAIEIEVPTSYPSNPGQNITDNRIRRSPAKAIRVDTGATVDGNTIYDITSASTHGIQVDNSDGYTRTVTDNIFEADTCEESPTQAAIDASDFVRDTARMPAGSCTWTTQVTASGKSFTFAGSGIDVTNITVSGVSPAFQVTTSATDFVTMTAFTMIDSAFNHGGQFIFQIHGLGTGASTASGDVGFRLHHAKFTAVTLGVRVGDNMYGLIDNNVFSGTGQMMRIVGDGDASSTNGSVAWSIPLEFGTDQFVYIEDNSITGTAGCDDLADGYSGSRIVVRHNALFGCGGGGHGTDSGSHRGVVFYEMSNNSMTHVVGDTSRVLLRVRSGTAMLYNNTGSYTSPNGTIWMQYWRATDGSVTPYGNWQRCTGAQYQMRTDWLGTNSGTLKSLVIPNADSWGSSGSHTRFFDGPDVGDIGYPCHDQHGRGPGQAYYPIYAWNNSDALGVYNVACGDDCPDAIQADREYYEEASAENLSLGSPFNGTTGTGWGAFIYRPTSCTTSSEAGGGVGYFDTTNNILWRCGPTNNNWVEQYTPYTYPHPLQSGAPEPPPDPPTSNTGRVMIR